MKSIPLFFFSFFLISCWKYNNDNYLPSGQKVWGNKPVYASANEAKQILYDPKKHPVGRTGNIYAFGNFIFQVDPGLGIHVIDNSSASNADRIGFITVKGCEQISIKGGYLYTNSFTDLVTIDISDPVNLRVVSRIPNAFPDYPLAQPEESGYYTCPRTDSVVIGWVKDSINISCYKN
jgi:hypothetical protein